MKNILIVPDLHGNLECITNLYKYLTDDCRIISPGDYIDDSLTNLPTINGLIKLKSRYNCYFICGNHDAALILLIGKLYKCKTNNDKIEVMVYIRN